MSMDVASISRPKPLSALLAYQFDPDYTVERVTLLGGTGGNPRSVPQFGVLMLGALTAVVAAGAGNTGNGAFGAVTVADGAKVGAYRIVCIEPAANAGIFEVYDPDGLQIGEATVGVAFAGPIGFTIADGSADFVSGDDFTVTVTGARVVQWDGVRQIHGLLLSAATAQANVDEPDIPVLRRGPARIVAAEIAWPQGSTAAQQAAGLAQLARMGILSA